MSDTLAYQEGGTELEAFVAAPPGDAARPAVLVLHAWGGLGDLERDRARALAKLGWVGVALDLYGRGVYTPDATKAALKMTPFMRDRALLERRLLAGLDAARAHPRVDPSRVAAIGYCFGGLCALDLARSGADVRGVVSFHGLFVPREGLGAPPVRAKILAIHGHDDPLASNEQALAFGVEMRAREADFQLHIHGGAKHAFTNPNAREPERGMQYLERADRRSWAAATSFLEEVLAT
jgi:dienelactone hydrolase